VIKKATYLFALIAFTGILWFFKNHNPDGGNFPKCPFKWATGYQCPGCGSQRATHHLLNGRFSEAFRLNPLFMVALPYIALGIFFEHYKRVSPVWRKRLFGPLAIRIVLVTVLLFWILRNVYYR
jgi:hypothetical protein